MPNYLSSLPRTARETIVRNVTTERITQGWGREHQLLVFGVHHLGETEGGDAYAIEARPLPLEDMPGDELYEKVTEAATRLSLVRGLGDSPVPVPLENFAGVLLIAEAWVSIREKLSPDDPMPSADPNRKEALTVTAVDLSGMWCDAVTLRDGETQVRDVESMSRGEIDQLFTTSRLYPPLCVLASLLNPERTAMVADLQARASGVFDEKIQQVVDELLDEGGSDA